ncbi:daunorubicin resistance protein DrrA family ABC transporter ATP-binding protein [soil metagenome]
MMSDTSNDSPIVISGLSKSYPGGIQAVNNVSLTVEHGEILALLGPNGAGKSSILKVLASLSPPTAGHVEICGFDVTRQRDQVVRRIGFVSQSTSYDTHATPDSHLRLYGRLYGLGRKASSLRAQELLVRFGLEAERRRKVTTLSGGMRRRLDILTALIHEPAVLIMDEPTTGLDPTGRRSVWSLIDELNSSLGITVLFTTHYLDEADQHAARVVVIDDGAVIAAGSPIALKDQLSGTSLVLRLAPDTNGEAAQRAVDGVPDTVRTTLSRDELHVVVRDARNSILPVLKALFDAHVPFTSVEVRHPSLEEVYFSITGKIFVAAEAKTATTAPNWGAYGKGR